MKYDRKDIYFLQMFDLIESSEILLSYNLSKLHLKLSILWWQDSGTFETNIIKIEKLGVAIFGPYPFSSA